MTTAAPPRRSDTGTVAELEAKIDALTEQVAFLAAEAREAKARRDKWTELSHDLTPIAGDAMQAITTELDGLDVSVTDLADLLRRLVRVAPLLDTTLGYLETFAELGHDVMPLTSQVMDLATARLAEADEKGYFTFAKSGLRIVDQVVTNFTDDDVQALGDNVVLILDTVKELTQPEIMAVLHRMIEAVQHQQEQMALEPEEAPSFFQLAKRLRDPDIRTGLGRALNTLSAVSHVDPTAGPARRRSPSTPIDAGDAG